MFTEGALNLACFYYTEFLIINEIIDKKLLKYNYNTIYLNL